MQTATEKSHYEALIAAIDVVNSAPEDPDMSSAFPRQIEQKTGAQCMGIKRETLYFFG